MTNLENALKKLKEHPYTQIQLSDREKFHTGMLKITLDVFQKGAYSEIFDADFAKDLYTSESQKIETCLEENSVDLSIKKGKEVYAIIESKFKTGLHYSNYKNRRVSQLTKYALNNPKTKHGFVVSLFPEQNEDLKISPEENAQIKVFKKRTYTDHVLRFLKNTSSKLPDDPRVPLITLWTSYLKDLKIVVDEFEFKNIKLEGISNNEDVKKLLSEVKLKGVFEGFRMSQVKQELEKELKEKNTIKQVLQTGAQIWKKPDTENNYIILGNTHGNASLSLVMTDEHKSISYGIQWQSGIVKVFIQPEGKNLEKWRKDNTWGKLRQEILENLIALFKNKWDEDEMKINKEGKFRSITVMKKELFTDISAMPGLLSKQVAFLKTQKVRKHIQPLLST